MNNPLPSLSITLATTIEQLLYNYFLPSSRAHYGERHRHVTRRARLRIFGVTVNAMRPSTDLILVNTALTLITLCSLSPPGIDCIDKY
jgi:hypothetical protein